MVFHAIPILAQEMPFTNICPIILQRRQQLLVLQELLGGAKLVSYLLSRLHGLAQDTIERTRQGADMLCNSLSQLFHRLNLTIATRFCKTLRIWTLERLSMSHGYR